MSERPHEQIPVDVPSKDGKLPVRCTTSRPRPDVCVAHLAGELDIATVPLVVVF
jgi:hypothetical protein